MKIMSEMTVQGTNIQVTSHPIANMSEKWLDLCPMLKCIVLRIKMIQKSAFIVLSFL